MRTSASTVVPDSPLRRAVDVGVAVLALVVLSPVLALVALAVRATSPGPVLFRQPRVGRGGADFAILKFRSMVAGADRLGPAVAGNVDARVTPMGRWLRRLKLDELPQLYNILRGDMTLIGPRAEVGRYVTHYTQEERETLAVRPGLSGPGGVWFTVHQADVLDGTVDPESLYIERLLHDKLELDLAYLRDRRLSRDVQVVAATLGLLLPARARRGAVTVQPVPAATKTTEKTAVRRRRS